MSTQGDIVEASARGLLSGVRWGRRHRTALSVLALVALLVGGVAYLFLNTLELNPARATIRVDVRLAQSGGLLPGQDVTLRGVAVGRVESVDIDGTGVRAVAVIDAAVPIPATGQVRVSSLSPAGEQFLDFQPTTDDGPYLTDGSVVDESNTSTPVPMATMLENMEPMLAQIDPDDLAVITKELGTGPEGVHKLRDIVHGGTFLVSTLHAVLPQTLGILQTDKVVLATLSETAPGLAATAANLDGTLRGVSAMDGGLRQLLEQTPATVRSIDALFADNSPTMVQLLGSLVTVTQMVNVRLPALQEFIFPQQRDGSTLQSIGTVFRDGGIWGAVDVYPRVPCDYPLPRSAPSRPDFPEPFLNTHCPDPQLLPRGAAAAPRPPGDDTDKPAPGSDPLGRTSPTPQGPQTLPTPYAGPPIHFN